MSDCVILCPMCRGVAFFKCEICGEEFVDGVQSRAMTDKRYAPRLREAEALLRRYAEWYSSCPRQNGATYWQLDADTRRFLLEAEAEE